MGCAPKVYKFHYFKKQNFILGAQVGFVHHPTYVDAHQFICVVIVLFPVDFVEILDKQKKVKMQDFPTE
jgi:hypothetical protein